MSVLTPKQLSPAAGKHRSAAQQCQQVFWGSRLLGQAQEGDSTGVGMGSCAVPAWGVTSQVLLARL